MGVKKALLKGRRRACSPASAGELDVLAVALCCRTIPHELGQQKGLFAGFAMMCKSLYVLCTATASGPDEAEAVSGDRCHPPSGCRRFPPP
eukprot:6202766-Pleurochrysis_carterae.AAC.1